jgi:hypothetical protein
MIPPEHQSVCLPIFTDGTCMCTSVEKRVIHVFSESCNAVSIQLRRGASAGTLKSIKIKFGPFTSLIDLDHLRFISH